MSNTSNAATPSNSKQQGQQRRFKWLRQGLLNVVFLVAPFGAWYFMHVQDALETNTIRSFRALSEVDTALINNVKNLPKIWEFSGLVDAYRESKEKSDAPAPPKTLSPDRLPYEKYIKLNPALKRIEFPTDMQAGDDRVSQSIYERCLERDKKRMLIDRALGLYWAQSVCIGVLGEDNRVPTLVQAPLDDLLGTVVEDVSARFDHVMLAAQDGRIVSQVETRKPRPDKMTGEIATDPFRYDYFNYSNLKPILEHSEDCAGAAGLLESDTDGDAGPKPLSHAVTCRIHVGKTRFVLFIQPSALDVRLRNDGNTVRRPSGGIGESADDDTVDANKIPGDPTSWFVIGVVRDASQLGQAFIAPVSVTGPVLVLIIIALAGLPLLWLSTKGRRALLTTTHFAFALGGSVIILALCAALGMHWLYNRDLAIQTDLSLLSLNQRIAAEFKDELNQRVGDLHAGWNDADECSRIAGDWKWREQSMPPFEARLVLGRKDPVLGPGNRYRTPPRSAGINVVPLESYMHYSPDSVWLEQREYYQQPVRGNLWRLGAEAHRRPFYIERIRSHVDGFKVAALSIPLRTEDAKETYEKCREALAPKRPEVLADIQPFYALFKAAMPPHHGFAVVESGSGKVLFHSSDNRSLDENFVDETDGDLHLISVMQTRSEAYLDLAYHGRNIRAYVAPLEAVPWNLVTFIDDEMIETVLLESLVTSSGLVVCYAFVLMLLTWAYAKFFEGRSAHRSMGWLWPVEHHSHQYPLLIGTTMLLSVALVAFAATGIVRFTAVHMLFFIGPLIALLLVRFIFPSAREASSKLGRFSAHAMHWAGSLILLGFALWYLWKYQDEPGSLWFGTAFLFTLLGAVGISRWLEHRYGSGDRGLTNGGEDADHSITQIAHSRLSQLRSILPLLAVMTYTGPAAGIILYLSVFDAFSDSYSRYADDQILRAQDLMETERKELYRRYFLSDGQQNDITPTPAPFSLGRVRDLNPCRGNYLEPGPFATDASLRGEASKPVDGPCPPGLAVTHEPIRDCRDISEPDMTRNWTRWFVRKLLVFSYESGALRESIQARRDAGRLRWCEKTGEDEGRRWFEGQSSVHPELGLHMPASKMSLKFVSYQDRNGSLSPEQSRWYSASMLSAAVFMIILVFILQYWIARTISHHLFGGHIQRVRLARARIDNLPRHAERAEVFISPVRIFDEVAGQFENPLVFSPHRWKAFLDPETGWVRKDLEISGEDVLIVDETEAIFGVEPQRVVLRGVLEAALDAGARVILLTRVDPFYWLDMLDSRLMFGSKTMPIEQQEVLVWNSLIRKFSIGLVSRRVGVLASPVEEAREHAQNWALSTPREKNVLANLAISDLYNPENLDVIRHLIQRGLVTNTVPHRLCEEGFRQHMLGSAELQSLKEWRREGADSLWSALWPTLLVVIALLMFFIVSAGQNTVKTAMTMIGSIIATLPVLMSVIAFARSGGGNR